MWWEHVTSPDAIVKNVWDSGVDLQMLATNKEAAVEIKKSGTAVVLCDSERKLLPVLVPAGNGPGSYAISRPCRDSLITRLK